MGVGMRYRSYIERKEIYDGISPPLRRFVGDSLAERDQNSFNFLYFLITVQSPGVWKDSIDIAEDKDLVKQTGQSVVWTVVVREWVSAADEEDNIITYSQLQSPPFNW